MSPHLLRIADTEIADVKLLEPVTFSDDRGFFLETWNARTLARAGLDVYTRANVVHGAHGRFPSEHA